MNEKCDWLDEDALSMGAFETGRPAVEATALEEETGLNGKNVSNGRWVGVGETWRTVEWERDLPDEAQLCGFLSRS